MYKQQSTYRVTVKTATGKTTDIKVRASSEDRAADAAIKALAAKGHNVTVENVSHF